jgi:hypothetical protein
VKFRIISTFFLFSALSWAADDDADEVLSVCKTAVAPKEATGAVSLFVKRDELGFPLGLTQQKEAVSEASKTAGDAQTSLTRSAGKLHSIGGRAKDAHSTARTASEKLDREYAEIVALSSSSGELVLSQSVLAPFFHDHLYAIGLATDNADFF